MEDEFLLALLEEECDSDIGFTATRTTSSHKIIQGITSHVIRRTKMKISEVMSAV